MMLSCDAAYQRTHALMGAVNDAGLRLVTKVSSNMTFSLNDQAQKAGVICDAVSRSQMKQNGRLEWQYRYHRIVAEHPIIGTVVLIVSELYNEIKSTNASS